MRSGLGWLCLALSGSCSQFIGLDEYRKAGESPEPGAGATAHGGSAGLPMGRSGASGTGPSGGGATGRAGGGLAGSGHAGTVSGTAGQLHSGGAPSEAGAGAAHDAGAGGGPEAGSAGVQPSRGGGGAGGTMPSAGRAGSTPVCTPRELLLDADFDAASANWVEDADNPIRIRLPAAPTANFPARSPSFAARLGGFNGGDADPYFSNIYQRVTIPVDTTELAASCYYRIATLESPTGEFDFASVALYEVDTVELVGNFQTWFDRDATNVWTQFTASFRNVAAVAGREVTFDLIAETDESFVTAFYFDSCSLVATVCP